MVHTAFSNSLNILSLFLLEDDGFTPHHVLASILDPSDVSLFLLGVVCLHCTMMDGHLRLVWCVSILFEHSGLQHLHCNMGTLDPFGVSLFLLEDNRFTPHHGHTRRVCCVFIFTRRQWVYTASWTFSTRLTCKDPFAMRVGEIDHLSAHISNCIAIMVSTSH